jgi:putative transposase
MLKVVQDPSKANPAGGSLLDEIVRDGARQMLAAAIEAEVAAYVEAHRGEVDNLGHRLVVRNGYHQPRGDHCGRRGGGAAAADQRQAGR